MDDILKVLAIIGVLVAIVMCKRRSEEGFTDSKLTKAEDHSPQGLYKALNAASDSTSPIISNSAVQKYAPDEAVEVVSFAVKAINSRLASCYSVEEVASFKKQLYSGRNLYSTELVLYENEQSYTARMTVTVLAGLIDKSFTLQYAGIVNGTPSSPIVTTMPESTMDYATPEDPVTALNNYLAASRKPKQP